MGQRIAIELFLMVTAGVVMGLIGPFGTFDIPLAQRTGWWVVMILAGYPLFRGLGTVARWAAETTQVPFALALTLGLAIASMPMTLIVGWLFMRATPGQLLQSPHILAFYGQVLVVGLIIHSAMWLLMRPAVNATESVSVPKPQPEASNSAESEPAAPAPSPSPALTPADSPNTLPLPPSFGPLLALKAEDHYLRAYAPDREEMFLMRLRDAVAMLPADAGVQVHRSWWVARDAVTEVAREGRSATLTLSNGMDVPVARDRMAAIKAAGWG
jgi:hypothetical protein